MNDTLINRLQYNYLLNDNYYVNMCTNITFYIVDLKYAY